MDIGYAVSELALARLLERECRGDACDDLLARTTLALRPALIRDELGMLACVSGRYERLAGQSFVHERR
jgi:hypothetical protein